MLLKPVSGQGREGKAGRKPPANPGYSKIMGWPESGPRDLFLPSRHNVKFLIDNWMLISVALASGGMLLWPLVAGSMNSGGLTASAAVQLINRNRAVVVDVSDAAEFAAGHVTGAKNVPFGELESRLPAVVKNKALPLILVCANGARSARAVAVAKKLGYEQAQTLGGGLKAWKEANLPIEKA
jgi:rhodanese-related sulfurtransferase